VLLYNCAKVGSPVGGPKDEDPPVIIDSRPENYSTEFNVNKIELTFNEFIQLKNILNELITSPPFDETPLTKLKGKSLVIELNNDLKDSTTYTLNFGNAIVDNNEGNPLSNFEFVFSTGDHVDSLSVTGKLVDAFNLQADKEPVFIMIYDNLKDSVPYLEIPSYIGKTNQDGTFAINNIKSDTFRIFALKDANSNLLFDQNSEYISFIDTPFIISPELIETADYYLADSLINIDSIAIDPLLQDFIIDSITGDTMLIEKKIKYALHVNMFLFQEENEFQYLTGKERITREKIMFTFKHSLYDSLSIIPRNFTYDNEWFLEEKSASDDTVICWIRDTAISNMDTISLQLKYTIIDSLKNYVTQIDTVDLRFREPKEKSKPGKKSKNTQDEVEKEKYLNLKLNINNGGTIDLNEFIRIITEKPITSYSDSLINIFKIEDTIEINQQFDLIKDTGKLRNYKIINKWEENTKYKLLIKPKTFTDMYGLSNDTILLNFSTQKSDYYGSIILTVENVASPLIIQLLDSKENILKEKYTSQSSSIKFGFLKPKGYKLKVVYDNNNNLVWDTGNYLKKLQPEKVSYYKDEINVRSNWDVEINWVIE